MVYSAAAGGRSRASSRPIIGTIRVTRTPGVASNSSGLAWLPVHHLAIDMKWRMSPLMLA
jgi:hypothetical protein